MRTYILASNRITCLRCGVTSYNRNDIEHLYCGHCHAYHEENAEDDYSDKSGPEQPKEPAD